MDSQYYGTNMQVKLLYTQGQGQFQEMLWDKPDIAEDQIEVQALMTGVCRSDVDMMQGSFGPLPLHMQGHEGLGRVTRCGAMVTDTKPGDIVATRGEPAYADFYNVQQQEYVVVPSAEPKYIIEPVACGVNLINQALPEIIRRSLAGQRMLILGSGFLAWVAYQTVLAYDLDLDITVVGNSNQDLWGDKLSKHTSTKYDIILDISSSDRVFNTDCVNNEALVIMGTQKTITTDFNYLLWRACTMIFPSPRTKTFYNSMTQAANLVESGKICVDKFWTRGYNRSTEWQQAFSDALNRKPGYNRGYITWS